MAWILFSVLALFSSVGNTIFNRISSHKIGSLLSACIKSFMITVACLIICLCFGHIKELYSMNKIDWLWVGVLGLITIIDWLFYSAYGLWRSLKRNRQIRAFYRRKIVELN